MRVSRHRDRLEALCQRARKEIELEFDFWWNNAGIEAAVRSALLEKNNIATWGNRRDSSGNN